MTPDAQHCDALNIEELVAHLDGELSSADAERVAAHVAACPACAREAELLAIAGEMVAELPRIEPRTGLADRVRSAAVRDDARAPAKRGALLRMWPAAAAAAVLVAALAARTMWDRPDSPSSVLTAAEERDIAADLYVLSNLETLEQVEPDELIALVEELDLLEALEPEMSGLYVEADADEGG